MLIRQNGGAQPGERRRRLPVECCRQILPPILIGVSDYPLTSAPGR